MGSAASFSKKDPKSAASKPRAQPVAEAQKNDTFKIDPHKNEVKSPPRNRKARQSVVAAVDDSKLKAFQDMMHSKAADGRLTAIKESSGFTKFKIEIPEGIAPGGSFTAVCNGLIVNIEVPDYCFPGDFLEIDLSDPVDGAEEDLMLSDDEIELTKKAALLFVKYNTPRASSNDKSVNDECVDIPELKRMLICEYSFKPGSKEIETELKLAGGPMVFEDFRYYFSQLSIRLEFYQHQIEAQQKLKDIKQQKQNIFINYQNEVQDGGQGREEVEEAIPTRDPKLKNEIESLRQELESRTSKYETELKALRERRGSLRKRKQTISIQSVQYNKLLKAEEKVSLAEDVMTEQKESGEELVKKIMQDFEDMTHMREKQLEKDKERLRDKVEQKRLARATLVEEEQSEEPPPVVQTPDNPSESGAPLVTSPRTPRDSGYSVAKEQYQSVKETDND